MEWLECDRLQPHLFLNRALAPEVIGMKRVPQAMALVLMAAALSATDLAALPTSLQQGQTSSKPTLAEVQIRTMLLDFLKGVPSNDPNVFDTFFADDVIYTRGAGVVITKSDIMKGLTAAPSATPKHEPEVTYDAEEVTVRQYG